MKLIWGKDHKSIIVVAETEYEIGIAEIFMDGMDCYQFATTHKEGEIVGAKYTVIPEES
jgi:hypothetical protein